MSTAAPAPDSWRLAVLASILLGSLAYALAHDPIAQDQAYHQFADRRPLLGVPNFWNVASNLPFLCVGGAGLALAGRRRLTGGSTAWIVFFAGVAFVSVGSGYYHWAPTDATLVWDRLPMTVGFMAMFVALLAESLPRRMTRPLLAPAVCTGFASVAWWAWSGDLRFYAWVQVAPLLTVVAVLMLFRARYSHRALLAVALVAYVAAKWVELRDRELFVWSGGSVGGHALKHLLAAAACLALLEMLRRRRRLPAVDLAA